MQDLIRHWDGAFVVIHQDRSTGSTIYVAVHTATPEAAAGGSRIQHYEDPRDALRDAMRLAEGMSLKFAVLDLPRGGGKAVLDVPRDLDEEARQGLLLRYGDLVESLRGVYQTGPDLGTTPEDMDRIATRTGHVFGTTGAHGGAGDPGPSTALGVFEGIRASLRFRFGSGTVEGRSILVQGAGHVGGPLVRMLAEAGGRILFSDTDPELRRRFEAEGHRFVEPEAALTTECDVLAPCAVGGILNRRTIPGLACAVVAGSANNLLDTPEDAHRLRERDILYAPDFVINGGGAVHLLGAETLGWSAAKVEERVRALGARLTDIFRQAEEAGITTEEAAQRVARQRLGAAARLGTV